MNFICFLAHDNNFILPIFVSILLFLSDWLLATGVLHAGHCSVLWVHCDQMAVGVLFKHNKYTKPNQGTSDYHFTICIPTTFNFYVYKALQ